MGKISHAFMQKKFQECLDKIKADFMQQQWDAEHWNNMHPDEEPLPIETWEEILESTGLKDKFKPKEA